MSSRRPRARFAAPLVVTLALAPACVVRTSTSSAPPPRPVGEVDDHRTGDAPPPPPIMNPPRPTDTGPTGTPPVEPPPVAVVNPPPLTPPLDRIGGGATTTVPPIKQTDPTIGVVQAGPTPTTPPTTTPGPTTWTVSQRIQDKVCFATLDVQCPPAPSTCNPPPARKLASCPDGAATGALKIQELSPGSCVLTYPAPACPSNMACNPPRPAAIACPG